MKKKIYAPITIILLAILVYLPQRSEEPISSKPEIRRSIASAPSPIIDLPPKSVAVKKSPDNDETTFKKEYQASRTLDIGSDQTLLVSENIFSIPANTFKPDLGEKILEFSGFVEYKPRGQSKHPMPVVFNKLYQKKGYLTGKLTLFYDDEFTLNNMINEIQANEMKVLLNDPQLKMLHVSYNTTDSLARVLKQYDKSEVDVFYFPIVAD